MQFRVVFHLHVWPTTHVFISIVDKKTKNFKPNKQWHIYGMKLNETRSLKTLRVETNKLMTYSMDNPELESDKSMDLECLELRKEM